MIFPPVTARHHMIDRTGVLESGRSGHLPVYQAQRHSARSCESGRTAPIEAVLLAVWARAMTHKPKRRRLAASPLDSNPIIQNQPTRRRRTTRPSAPRPNSASSDGSGTTAVPLTTIRSMAKPPGSVLLVIWNLATEVAV